MAPNSAEIRSNLQQMHTLFAVDPLKDVERFRNGSVREQVIVNNLSRTTYREHFIENHLLSNYSKTIHKSYPDLDCDKDSSVEIPNSYQRIRTAESQVVNTPVWIIGLLVLCAMFFPLTTHCLNVFFKVNLIVITFVACVTINLSISKIDVFVDNVVVSTIRDIDSDILDKTNNLTGHVYSDVNVSIKISKNTRTRYSQYVYYNYRDVKSSSTG